jgi:putative tryptophan/tyrosine transport system substrate-binding protein
LENGVILIEILIERWGRMRGTRRNFIRFVGGAMIVAAGGVGAQTPSRIYRLGTLTPGSLITEDSPFGSILIRELAQRGYTLGKNLTFEARGAAGQVSQLPQLLREFKAGNVDVIVVIGYPAALAAKAIGIPTVIAYGAGDPVATGLVDGLARPGGNITGISDVATTLTTKRLALLKEIAPQLRRVAMLWNKGDLGMTLRYEASAKVAQTIGITVQPLGVREPNDFEEAFTAMNSDPPDAILMVSDSMTSLNRKRVFELAAARRLPAIYEYDFLVRDGGLMSYGPDLKESFERAAALVDRIFKGARPADLPFEQPTRYPFVINLKTAKAIGLEVPTVLLALADEVIE